MGQPGNLATVTLILFGMCFTLKQTSCRHVFLVSQDPSGDQHTPKCAHMQWHFPVYRDRLVFPTKALRAQSKDPLPVLTTLGRAGHPWALLSGQVLTGHHRRILRGPGACPECSLGLRRSGAHARDQPPADRTPCRKVHIARPGSRVGSAGSWVREEIK